MTPTNTLATLTDALHACQVAITQQQPSAQPLDMPDSPGWWAWEGYIQYTSGKATKLEREVVRVFWGTATSTWQVVRERGRHPAYMLIGKWYRLTMPWEAQEHLLYEPVETYSEIYIEAEDGVKYTIGIDGDDNLYVLNRATNSIVTLPPDRYRLCRLVQQPQEDSK